MPAWRDGPPYAMTEMIAAEPALAERLVGRLSADPGLSALGAALRTAARTAKPVMTTGCGTSEHAAMVVATLLSEALGGRVLPMQALELARRPPSSGVVIGVSHEGGTWATNLALDAARSAGALTALITVSDRSPGAVLADLLLTTGEQDQSWCHTVGYLSPILAGAALAAELRGEPLDASAVRALLGSASNATVAADAERAAARLATCTRLLVVGSGIDYPGARELALKIEEGAHLPASAMLMETIRHGHLAAVDERTGLILLLTDADDLGEPLLERARAVLRSAAALGMRAAAILADDLATEIPAALTPAGRISVPVTALVPRTAGAAIGSAIPLQLLAERLARARGTNPDTIGREDPRQAAAADA